jgi:hypothetical protein
MWYKIDMSKKSSTKRKTVKSKKVFANAGKKTLGTDAKIIKRYIGEGGLSLRQMATASGVSHTTVIQWGQGVCAPSDVTLKRLNKVEAMRGLVNELVTARVQAIGLKLAELGKVKKVATKAKAASAKVAKPKAAKAAPKAKAPRKAKPKVTYVRPMDEKAAAAEAAAA